MSRKRRGKPLELMAVNSINLAPYGLGVGCNTFARLILAAHDESEAEWGGVEPLGHLS